MYNSDLDDDDVTIADSAAAAVSPKRRKLSSSTTTTVKWPGSIIVLDLDGTLIDKYSMPYPNAKKFIMNLQKLTKNVHLCLWTMGNKAHVERAIEDCFSNICFDEIRCGSHCDLVGKPITVVRQNVCNPNSFIGPTIIIDDFDENLSPSQYDIVKDVKKYYCEINNKIVVDYKRLYNNIVTDRLDWIEKKLK